MSLILSGTDGLSEVDGSASTPAIRGTDTNTGIFFPAANTVAASTDGTERMRIDSSGRVTKAYQPSFHVRINTAVYTTSTPLPFTNVVFDVGSNFNTSTYRFTAPIAGKYLFILSVYARIDNNEDFYPFLRVNGYNTQYSAFYNNGTGGQIHNTSVVTAIFNLSANDYVDSIYTGGGDYYGGNQETNLFGYLLG